MDSEEKRERSDDEEPEDDSSLPDLEEFSEKSLETQATSASERNAEAQSSGGDSARNVAASESSGTPFSLETGVACRILGPAPYTSLTQRRRELNVREEDKDAAAESSGASFSLETEGASRIPDPGPYASLIQRRREQNVREDDKDAAAESSGASSSLETEGARRIPDPGPYTSLIQRRRELKVREEDKDDDQHSHRLDCISSALHGHFIASGLLKSPSRRTDDACRRKNRDPISSPRRHRELKPTEKSTDEHHVEDKPVENSSTASSRSNSGRLETYSMDIEGACGISEPSTEEATLIRRYQVFTLMENSQRERVPDRAIETSPRRNAASSSMLEASLRASEGAIGLPGPFASFIQRHRDFDLSDDNSEDERFEDRPVWPLERRQRATSASYRDSRSGSLGECSEESLSRSTSEASSGLQENKEASASDSSPLQQPPHGELNPPDDNVAGEDGDTDEDEGDLETEEHYNDSDSERKGYSL